MTQTKKTKVIRRAAMGFRTSAVYQRRAFPLWQYISHKFAFWTALLSLMAFVGGNLVGQHGVNAVLTAAFGEVDERLISYSGIVSPIRVPDYAKWQREGGVPSSFTYDQVPNTVLRNLPAYDAHRQNAGEMASVYSVGYMGSYEHGGHGDGSHPGVDIRAPHGTPIVSAMDGLIVRADSDSNFGNVVVVKTLNAPDPQSSGKPITLFAGYAHMSSMSVSVGDIVKKGQMIGRVGATGFATGNHVHFQIDRSYLVAGREGSHPMWPFTWEDSKKAGLSFMASVDEGLGSSFAYSVTVSPMEYVQAGYAPLGTHAVAQNQQPVETSGPSADERRAARIQARKDRVAAVERTKPVTVVDSRPEAVAPVQVLSETTTVTEQPVATPVSAASREVAAVAFQTQDGTFPLRQWRPVRLIFLDEDGKEIQSPRLKSDLYLRTTFGKAEIKPDRISELDIVNGQVRVQVLGLSPTVLLTVYPLDVTSPPLRFENYQQ